MSNDMSISFFCKVLRTGRRPIKISDMFMSRPELGSAKRKTLAMIRRVKLILKSGPIIHSFVQMKVKVKVKDTSFYGIHLGEFTLST